MGWNMTGTNRAGRDGEAPFDHSQGRRDWLWAIGLLAGLGGLSWAFDRCLHFF
jgi:hypothetical protein